MEIPIGTSLIIVGVSILVLLAVLSVFAGLIYFLTGIVKDDETSEDMVAIPAFSAAVPGVDVEREGKKKIALIAAAIARAAQAGKPAVTESEGAYNSWHLFHHSRRLNQTIRVRRNS